MAFVRDSTIVFRRQIRMNLRNPAWVLIGIMQPVLCLVLFGPLLDRNAPDVVVVDDNRFKLGFGARAFDYLAYFQSDPKFAHFWRRYHEVSRIENFRVFRRGETPARS